MSDGMRSGVNCIRATFRDIACARARISNVLPRPGTPSPSTCPETQGAMMVWSTTAVWPTLSRSLASNSPARRIVFDSSFITEHLGFENLLIQLSPRLLEQHDCRPLRFRTTIEIFAQRIPQSAGVEARARRQRADALRGVHPFIEREPPECRLGKRLALGAAQGCEASSTPGKACSGANLLGERAAHQRRRRSDRPEARQVAPDHQSDGS